MTKNKSLVREKLVMEYIAKETGLVFDGNGYCLHFDDEQIHVAANLMTKSQYNSMEKELRNTVIKKKNYTIYAWNDVSGYDYWKEAGEDLEFNYVQVSFCVKNPLTLTVIEMLEIKKEMENMFYYYKEKYDNHQKAYDNCIQHE